MSEWKEVSLPLVARLVAVSDESPTVRTLVLDRSLAAEPGQFIMMWLPGVDEKPFSLVHADPVTLTVAHVGPFTAAVHALAPGDRAWLRGPFGQGFSLPKGDPPGPATGGQSDFSAGRDRPSPDRPEIAKTGNPKSLLLVAGGCGVAPLHFLAERAVAAGWPVSTVIGARTAAEVVLAGRFAALGIDVHTATEDGSLGERGLATEAAERLVAARGAFAFGAIYACGPEPMLVAVQRLARGYGLPVQLSFERYMRCGFGVCGSCTREGWLVCTDGPVRRT